jgi:hypothetical protein
VSLLPCSGCDKRVKGKLSTIYWAWFKADQTRSAYRQRLCADCFTAMVTQVAIRAGEELVMCPVCGIATMDDMDPVYADIFLPGQDKVRAEMALCAACAVGVRNNAMKGAEPLPDRGSEVGGPQPPNGSPNDAWAAVGIVPR